MCDDEMTGVREVPRESRGWLESAQTLLVNDTAQLHTGMQEDESLHT